ncbi:hypothetical protein SAMN03159343_0316 [Klenkia marina]|uniref:Uncharacterized protein n=1 Tax=Klenkia marina TaxID=1960309 RepID=A0A1G4XA84_9ACTN|nr:hypothetical protein [Klenkia marina]SCX38150.1 hypothetical protein SAMN03159343_0316 [Klenkia marina]
MAGLWVPLLVVVVAVVGLSWDTDSQGVPPVAGRCTIAGSPLTLTNEQAANAATIAAVSRSRGLPERATTIALATAQQESRLRNLAYGDRDSLGLFQQRPSQGWGTPDQVQDPVYATGKFLDGLVEVPGWDTGRLTEVAQAVQRSGFPEAYQQWEEMGTTLSRALLATTPAALSCTYSPPDAAGPVDERAAAVADVVRREAGAPTVLAGGVVSVAATGWPEATWAVAHARTLQLTEVRFTDWTWTPTGGWVQTGEDAGALLLQLAV